MNSLQEIKENIHSFLCENTKITVGISVLLLILTAAAVFSGFFQERGKPKEFVFPDEIPFSAVEEFFPPEKDALTEEYYFSREQGASWDTDEFSRWFTVPSKENVEALGKANEKTASEILGAAP
ncbi:hypothetical protein [Treponema sp.]|uniref:hypothetical protein n=1 Tax=Treponema sp. TaxID=166 RepID=UPI003F0C5A40